MSIKSKLAIALGGLIGTVVGVGIGTLIAPRSGAESRAMAADAMNDAWDSAVDTYERGASKVSEKIGSVRPSVDATTDDLRAKVDLARERMDQLRESLSDAVATTSAQVSDAVSAVTDKGEYLGGTIAPGPTRSSPSRRLLLTLLPPRPRAFRLRSSRRPPLRRLPAGTPSKRHTSTMHELRGVTCRWRPAFSRGREGPTCVS